MLRALIFVTLCAVTGCVPFILPPMRTDLGVPVNGPRGLRLTTGAHTAGITRDDGPALDLGVGWVGELPPDGGVGRQGGYLEVGVLGPRAPWRPSVGLRTEITGETADTLAASARIRLGIELSVPASGGRGGRCAASVYSGGDAGLGVYVDAGRDFGGEEGAWVATVGLSARTPVFAGWILLLPGC